jgi:hypothetical protein
MAIMHYLRRRVRDWDNFVQDNKQLTTQMNWEPKKKTFINDFIAFALFCSIKGLTVSVEGMRATLLSLNKARCPVWEFFIAPMLSVAYAVFPALFDRNYILTRNLKHFYKQSQKPSTTKGTLSLSYLREN